MRSFFSRKKAPPKINAPQNPMHVLPNQIEVLPNNAPQNSVKSIQIGDVRTAIEFFYTERDLPVKKNQDVTIVDIHKSSDKIRVFQINFGEQSDMIDANELLQYTKRKVPAKINAPPNQIEVLPNNAPQNSVNSIQIGEVRTVTEEIDEGKSYIPINNNLIIINVEEYGGSSYYTVEFEDNGRKEEAIVTANTLLNSTKKKELPIKIGTRLIPIKNYGTKDSLFSFITDNKLEVTSIHDGSREFNGNNEVVIINNVTSPYNIFLNLVDTSYKNQSTGVMTPRFTFLDCRKLLIYTKIDDSAVEPTKGDTHGGNRKSKSFLKKQRKSKKNYMRALRNFIKTRKRTYKSK